MKQDKAGRPKRFKDLGPMMTPEQELEWRAACMPLTMKSSWPELVAFEARVLARLGRRVLDARLRVN